MASQSIYKPGIVRGLYPEKSASDFSFLDRSWARWREFSIGLVRYNPRSLRAIVKSVRNRGQALKLLSAKKLDDRIQALKSEVAVQGLDDDSACHAFALIREVAGRKLGMRHFDVQLVGGWVMLKGFLAEMETGEGKTLVATLPACTAAMAGIPVHIVTVNDYLVQRDASLMEPIYHAFGLSVGFITEEMDLAARQSAYACDITYCSNKQLTFDYLKDRLIMGGKDGRLQLQLERLYANQAAKRSQFHLRGLCFAIVDEADSVLIDESRTPLIISRENDSLDQLHIYQQALEIALQLEMGRDFIIDQRNRLIELTVAGINLIKQGTAQLSGIWAAERHRLELVKQALSAQHLFHKDVNYLVKEGKILIIDEFTGRVMADRSWERGLHQLIETKEGCVMSGQKETLCRISYQTFFRRYLHLAGMTGTAKEVARELFSVYRIPVISIPTNKPKQRKQLPTRYFATAGGKWGAIVERIIEVHGLGRPILVGTRSVEASEHLGRLLSDKGLPHRILNARQDTDEAEVIKEAGLRGCITVATNMAGRGTDIKLGEGVNELGGLHVIASECHESRRIDRQLFGRGGRQGNEGSYEMLLSLEDEIVEKYAPAALVFLARKIVRKNDGVLNALARIVFNRAQIRAERHHAFIRIGLLKMDSNLQNLLAFSGKSE